MCTRNPGEYVDGTLQLRPVREPRQLLQNVDQVLSGFVAVCALIVVDQLGDQMIGHEVWLQRGPAPKARIEAL